MVNGTLFTRVRRCPCCMLKNMDLNVLTSGYLSASVFQIWARGTSENPEGPTDKLCSMVFVLGGLSTQYPNLDGFWRRGGQIGS